LVVAPAASIPDLLGIAYEPGPNESRIS
jgi:hypothetical protein